MCKMDAIRVGEGSAYRIEVEDGVRGDDTKQDAMTTHSIRVVWSGSELMRA
jgi:hypothetical protein